VLVTPCLLYKWKRTSKCNADYSTLPLCVAVQVSMLLTGYETQLVSPAQECGAVHWCRIPAVLSGFT
jgi:hypothetical protein